MKVIELDARGLLPPEPMVRILEAAAAAAQDDELRARTDRRPMHLFPQLEARGFRTECVEQPDGSFLTLIRHA
jgi:TusA-related sulfurtransferase